MVWNCYRPYKGKVIVAEHTSFEVDGPPFAVPICEQAIARLSDGMFRKDKPFSRSRETDQQTIDKTEMAQGAILDTLGESTRPLPVHELFDTILAGEFVLSRRTMARAKAILAKDGRIVERQTAMGRGWILASRSDEFPEDCQPAKTKGLEGLVLFKLKEKCGTLSKKQMVSECRTIYSSKAKIEGAIATLVQSKSIEADNRVLSLVIALNHGQFPRKSWGCQNG